MSTQHYTDTEANIDLYIYDTGDYTAYIPTLATHATNIGFSPPEGHTTAETKPLVLLPTVQGDEPKQRTRYIINALTVPTPPQPNAPIIGVTINVVEEGNTTTLAMWLHDTGTASSPQPEPLHITTTTEPQLHLDEPATPD